MGKRPAGRRTLMTNFVTLKFRGRATALRRAPARSALSPSHPRKLQILVAKDGIEPPTQGFSILCSTD